MRQLACSPRHFPPTQECGSRADCPARRLAKLNTGRKKKMKRDPGIPNLWPHKDKLLRQLEAKARSEQ